MNVRIGSCALVLLGACSGLEMSEDEYRRILSIDVDGDTFPIEVVDDDTVRTCLESQIADMIDALEDWRRDPSVGEQARNHVVISIHGGLVNRQDGLESARLALKGGIDSIGYPIFVNWETGIARSYRDHLFHVRSGEGKPLLAVMTSPFYFLADVGRTLFRLPITLTRQGGENLVDLVQEHEPEPVPASWKGTVALGEQEDRRWSERLGSGIQTVVPGAVRPLTTLFLDGGGLPAYHNMRRRARVLFLLDGDFDTPKHRQRGALSRLAERLRGLPGVPGRRRSDPVRTSPDELIQAMTPEALAQPEPGDYLLEELRRYIDECEAASDASELWLRALTFASEAHEPHGRLPDCEDCHQLERLREAYLDSVPLQITIIAHSMGALVANEFVRRNPDLVFRDIVYMGAAAPIHDFADTALVYVKEHPFAHFWNLCLHPEDERGERYGFGILPHGSLLEWIDDYITHHRSRLDRTLGKWDNVVAALPVLDYLASEIRSRIHVRGFGGGEGQPVGHGDFRKFAYWKTSYWNPFSKTEHAELEDPRPDVPWQRGETYGLCVRR